MEPLEDELVEATTQFIVVSTTRTQRHLPSLLEKLEGNEVDVVVNTHSKNEPEAIKEQLESAVADFVVIIDDGLLYDEVSEEMIADEVDALINGDKKGMGMFNYDSIEGSTTVVVVKDNRSDVDMTPAASKPVPAVPVEEI